MHEIEKHQHELYARLPAFERKVERAQEIIKNALRQEESWSCSFSGGADSTVVLHLLSEMNLLYDIECFHGDDGVDFPQTLQFIQDTNERYQLDLMRVRCMQPWRDWCLEMDRPDLCEDPEALEAWGNPHEWNATWDLLNEAQHHGYRGVFLGLLACESRERRIVLRNGSRPLYQVASDGGIWHCSPLAAWTKRDVWGYLISREVPYNPVYDKLAELGVPLEYRRVGPLTCFRTMQWGSHAILKSGWPDLYNTLCATFPNVRNYA